MGLTIPVETGAEDVDEFLLTEFELAEQNYFILSNQNDPLEKIRVLFPFACKDIMAPYTVQAHLFQNVHISQSDVIELKTLVKVVPAVQVKGEKEVPKPHRIGYIFTINALLEPANSPFTAHTFSFAYYAFEKLVAGEANCRPKVPMEKKDEYTLSDFYDPDYACAVICNENLVKVPNFNFDHYLFGLFNYGFTFVADQQKPVRINKADFIRSQFASIKADSVTGKQVLTIVTAPFVHSETDYPVTLIKYLIGEDSHFLTRFHTLYQVFEMLNDDILKTEIKLQICSGTDHLPGHKLKEKVSKLATDGYRVNLLITKYSKTSKELTVPLTEKLGNLVTQLNPLYQEAGAAERVAADLEDEREENTEGQATQLAGLLVKLRNDLVHNYRWMHAGERNQSVTETLILDIIDDLELLTCEIIATFGRQPDRKLGGKETVAAVKAIKA